LLAIANTMDGMSREIAARAAGMVRIPVIVNAHSARS